MLWKPGVEKCRLREPTADVLTSVTPSAEPSCYSRDCLLIRNLPHSSTKPLRISKMRMTNTQVIIPIATVIFLLMLLIFNASLRETNELSALGLKVSTFGPAVFSLFVASLMSIRSVPELDCCRSFAGLRARDRLYWGYGRIEEFLESCKETRRNLFGERGPLPSS